MNITTLKGTTYNLSNITGYTVVEIKKNPPSWGWWLLWVVLFYPALLILIAMCFRKKYLVEMKNNTGFSVQEWLSSDTFEVVERNFKSSPANSGKGVAW